MKKDEERFDFGSAAVGVIVTLGSVLVAVMLTNIADVLTASACEIGETGVTCVREWSGVVAVFAGAGTVIFLARQQAEARRNRAEDRQHELEMLALQTMPIRAKIDRALRYVTQIEVRRDRMLAGMFFESPNDDPTKSASTVFYAVRGIYRIVSFSTWSQLNGIDGTIEGRRKDLKYAIEKYVGDNLEDGYDFDDFARARRVSKVLARSIDRQSPQLKQILRDTDELIATMRFLSHAASENGLRTYFADRMG